MTSLGEAEKTVQKGIETFDHDTSRALIAEKALQDHVSSPLSSILCQGQNSATTTIDTHLLNLQRTLQDGESSLTTLQEQWNGSAAAEIEARRSLARSNVGNHTMHGPPDAMELDDLFQEMNKIEESALKEIDNEESVL